MLSCATTPRDVVRWEAEGDLPALKRALRDRDPAVRRAAKEVFLRYAAYDTCRPAMLATLERAGSAEAREAVQELFGQPPRPTPDPGAGERPRRPGQVVLYLYRPAEKERGAPSWFAIDGRRVARLRPGHHHRHETSVGSHTIIVELPPPGKGEEPPPPMRFVVSAPMAGVYFVRHSGAGSKPAFDVMPVPPALQAVKACRPAPPEDVDPEEARRRAEPAEE
jgi:hypothetical protein